MVAPVGDAHGDAVENAVLERGGPVVRAAVDAMGDARFMTAPASPLIVDLAEVAEGWSVWWHRCGVLPPIPGAGAAEQALADDEARALFLGGLLALGVRWVDEPFVVERAEHTLLQLAVARERGAAVPDTIATSNPARAAAFLKAGPAVAKAVSSGPGLAPFASAVAPAMLPGLLHSPTLLQRLVLAAADVRLVVIGDHVLGWRRERGGASPVDWRAVDPAGEGFVPVPVEAGLALLAVAICAGLGLSTAVQDWLVDASGRSWFLEVNPVGRWLFLAGADEAIPPRLADHLVGTIGRLEAPR